MICREWGGFGIGLFVLTVMVMRVGALWYAYIPTVGVWCTHMYMSGRVCVRSDGSGDVRHFVFWGSGDWVWLWPCVSLPTTSMQGPSAEGGDAPESHSEGGVVVVGAVGSGGEMPMAALESVQTRNGT